MRERWSRKEKKLCQRGKTIAHLLPHGKNIVEKNNNIYIINHVVAIKYMLLNQKDTLGYV